MARREPHALAGNEIDELVARRGRCFAHRRHHAVEFLRTGDRRNIGESVADRLGLRAHAAGDDHLAVLVHGFADRGQGFRLGAVEKTAGVDDDRVRAGVGARKLVTFGAKSREDALAVDERLRAAERDEGYAWARARGGFGVFVHRLPFAWGTGAGKGTAYAPRRPPLVRRAPATDRCGSGIQFVLTSRGRRAPCAKPASSQRFW